MTKVGDVQGWCPVRSIERQAPARRRGRGGSWRFVVFSGVAIFGRLGKKPEVERADGVDGEGEGEGEGGVDLS
jgi:hypothetical protein